MKRGALKMNKGQQENVISKEVDPQEALADLPASDESALQAKGGRSSATGNSYGGLTDVLGGTI
jgi:hypothetical protein